ncbi:anti sigma factor C-terminal domain-containing protein [Oceanobacillus kimchii]|uniref:anti sigma factor C-terminal domain-containing protein n=1 Tax=Oceanobacillus kimchii TaxID=746691 RepID=UPI00158D1D3A
MSKKGEYPLLCRRKQSINKYRTLPDQSESYYTIFLDLNHLQTQYQYIKEEGFITYGAVVTGPVKELKNLRTYLLFRMKN